MSKESKPKKTKYFGFWNRNVIESEIPNEKDRMKLVKDAEENLTCIMPAERSRRKLFGISLIIFSMGLFSLLTYYKVSVYITGLVCYLPITAGYGLYMQGIKGLCNISQKGLWDVDGTGMKKIEDKVIAEKILKKVKNLNKNALITGALITLALINVAKFLIQ